MSIRIRVVNAQLAEAPERVAEPPEARRKDAEAFFEGAAERRRDMAVETNSHQPRPNSPQPGVGTPSVPTPSTQTSPRVGDREWVGQLFGLIILIATFVYFFFLR